MNGKEAWRIGRLGERKTRDLLKNKGFVIIGSNVDAAGVDILAFKKGKIYIIEVKTTKKIDKTWKQLITKKQFLKYKKLQRLLTKQKFDVLFILYLWKKVNNKWIYEVYDLTEEDWR